MSDELVIQSHKGPYHVAFDADGLAKLAAAPPAEAHYIVDARVADLYAAEMVPILAQPSVLRIEATEENKSLERFPAYVAHLVARGLRRDHVLVALGGGIIQDITCFLAATMLRGVEWRFYPTTLLAQADSCIGSKSSINAGAAKNILGTFTPPRRVVVSTCFLATLDDREVRSGIGEMLKVHAIEGPEAFDRFAAGYDRLFTDAAAMQDAIRDSLLIKRRFIEADEFDQGPRLVFNYGHSFGHAIEAATDFAVPHGIAVTIGMDMANHVAWSKGLTGTETFQRMHPVLARNFRGYERHPVPLDRFMAAIAKDKKNVGGDVTLILPGADGRIARGRYPNDAAFREACRRYLDEARAA